jgi:hypothetical protein
MLFYQTLAIFLDSVVRLKEIVRTRKFWFCVCSFFLTMVIYTNKRSFGTVSGVLQESLGVSKGLLNIIPSMFFFVYIIGAWLGPVVDRNPTRWILVGVTGGVVGFLGCSLNTHSYPLFLSFSIVAAFGSMMAYFGISSFSIRPDEFGTTWFFVPESLARTFAPALLTVPAIFMGMKFDAEWLFLGIACAVVLFAILFYLVIKKLPYRKNPHAPVIIHKWIKEQDYWANVLAGISFDSSPALISTSFLFIFRQNGTSDMWAAIYYLGYFGVFGVLGRIFFAEFGHRVSTRLGVSIGIAFITLGLILIPTGFYGECVGLALVGFGMGPGTSNQRCYFGDRYGQEQIMSRAGSMYTGIVPFSTAIIIMSGFISDSLGNYFLVYWILATVTAFASMTYMSEKNINWVNRKNSIWESRRDSRKEISF